MLSAITIQQPITDTGLGVTSRSILRILLYFKIFNYPIKKEELFGYVHSNNKIEVHAALSKLICDEVVFCKDDFVWVMNEQAIVENRIIGNIKAERFLKIARRQARLLSLFPFIKCICISGSLSKLYMDDHSDIDYFIIARKRRLWITKFLMSLIVVSLEVLGLRKFFCPNYIITEDNLEVEDRNIYTAMEIVTLIPLYNKSEFDRFINANEWVKEYFPYYEKNYAVVIKDPGQNPLTILWRTAIFTWIDTGLFKFYQRRFANKVRKGKIIAFGNDMVINENNFKLHLSGHRKRILQKLEENIEAFENRYGIML